MPLYSDDQCFSLHLSVVKMSWLIGVYLFDSTDAHSKIFVFYLDYSIVKNKPWSLLLICFMQETFETEQNVNDRIQWFTNHLFYLFCISPRFFWERYMHILIFKPVTKKIAFIYYTHISSILCLHQSTVKRASFQPHFYPHKQNHKTTKIPNNHSTNTIIVF